MSDDVGKAVNVNPLNLGHSLHERLIQAWIKSWIIQSIGQRDCDEANNCAMAKYFGKYRYDYERGIISPYVSTTTNSEGASYEAAMRNVDGTKSPRDDLCIFTSDAYDICPSVKILRVESGVYLVAELLRIRYAVWVDGMRI